MPGAVIVWIAITVPLFSAMIALASRLLALRPSTIRQQLATAAAYFAWLVMWCVLLFSLFNHPEQALVFGALRMHLIESLRETWQLLPLLAGIVAARFGFLWLTRLLQRASV